MPACVTTPGAATCIARTDIATRPDRDQASPAMRMLVSVRDLDEARDAAAAGVDFIDLKEPRAGALGGLPLDTIRAICAALRDEAGQFVISATIGDLPADASDAILARIEAVATCGVDLVKVGVPGTGQQALALLVALAQRARADRAIVPVLLADDGLAPALVEAACVPQFAAVMADTQRKRAGSLFDLVAPDELTHLVARARQNGVKIGLAGALRTADVPRLAQLGPDFAGFRSAVCDGARETRLNPESVLRLRRALANAVVARRADCLG